MKKIVFIIGNGFNYFVSDYVSNESFMENIISKLENVKEKNKKIWGMDSDINEWKKECEQRLQNYCHLLDDICLNNDNNINKGEYLLSDISNFCKKIGNQNIISTIEDSISKKIKNDMTKQVIRSNVPKTIRSIFIIQKDKKNNISFANALYNMLNKKGYSEANIYTTNYDKIVNSIFEDKRKAKNKTIKSNIVALHGDYDSKIICCAPESKIKKISNSIFRKFEEDVKEADCLVLFGLGLFSDPHILSLINQYKQRCIYIIDKSKKEYAADRNYRSSSNKIGFDYLYNNHVHFINTKEFDVTHSSIIKALESPEELISYFEKNL